MSKDIEAAKGSFRKFFLQWMVGVSPDGLCVNSPRKA